MMDFERIFKILDDSYEIQRLREIIFTPLTYFSILVTIIQLKTNIVEYM